MWTKETYYDLLKKNIEWYSKLSIGLKNILQDIGYSHFYCKNIVLKLGND